MSKPPTLRQQFWLYVCRAVYRFCYRRVLPVGGREPVGIPGRRDPDSRCHAYAPVAPIRNNVWFECEGDGHYLCHECCHYKPEQEDA